MKSLHSSSAALLLLFSLAVPTGANAELDFNLAVVSDYRFRGLSQSRLRPAVQGGVDYSAGDWVAPQPLQAEQWFVLGDNVPVSVDSRLWSSIDGANILGPVRRRDR